MINLILSKKYFSYFFVILLLVFVSSKSLGLENKILFKINEKAFTTLDYDTRLRYLDFVGNNNELSKEVIINDFISANIFYEYYLNSNNKNNYKNKINEIYENIKKINEQNDKKYNFDIDEENILINIELDFVRKSILEKILNSNLNNLNKSNEEIDLLYKIEVKYINFKKKNKDYLINIINDLDNANFEEVLKILNDKKINYFVKEKEIDNISSIQKTIREKIISNKNSFILDNNNETTIIFINKSFETLDGINVNLYSVRSKEEIESEKLRCNYLNTLNEGNIIQKEYKLENLNNELKNNLIDINDYVKFQSEEQIIYVVLCDIKFDEKILNNVIFNKLINENVSDIERKFINKYSKIYSLKKFNE